MIGTRKFYTYWYIWDWFSYNVTQTYASGLTTRCRT